ncbi:MAG TPA: GTP-binding protein, partial [Kineosporiaceae bacterium]|nr:GTP-binding protein [Kineosporiaceae bacterium]
MSCGKSVESAVGPCQAHGAPGGFPGRQAHAIPRPGPSFVRSWSCPLATRPYLNLGTVAHVDAGKTSLTERLLYDAGVIDAPGRLLRRPGRRRGGPAPADPARRRPRPPGGRGHPGRRRRVGPPHTITPSARRSPMWTTRCSPAGGLVTDTRPRCPAPARVASIASGGRHPTTPDTHPFPHLLAGRCGSGGADRGDLGSGTRGRRSGEPHHTAAFPTTPPRQSGVWKASHAAPTTIPTAAP